MDFRDGPWAGLLNNVDYCIQYYARLLGIVLLPYSTSKPSC